VSSLCFFASCLRGQEDWEPRSGGDGAVLCVDEFRQEGRTRWKIMVLPYLSL
jgi:hypothetical protein